MSAPAASESTGSTQNGGDANPFGNSRSADLYLFTFLATLVLLLTISSTIVIRSMCIRRRLQRRLEQAMAAGIFLTPNQQSSRRKALVKKPALHDAWIEHGEGNLWQDIMPLSTVVLRSRKRKDRPQSSRPNLPIRSPWWKKRPSWWWDAEVEAVSPPPSEPPELAPNLHSTATEDVQGTKFFQISVLVAMPDARRSNLYCSDGRTSKSTDNLPEISFGVTRIPCLILERKSADQNAGPHSQSS